MGQSHHRLYRRNSPASSKDLLLDAAIEQALVRPTMERTSSSGSSSQHRRAPSSTCTAVSLMACIILFQVALFAGQNFLARTSAVFLSTEHMTLLDVVYLHDITICKDVGPRRQCSSPECSVPWPMECPSNAVGTSRTSGHTCGLGCGSSRFATVLDTIVDELTDRFSDECHELVVYSVAFGEMHEKTILQPPALFNATTGLGSKLNASDMHATHGQCFFTFVLASDTVNGVATQKSADGLDWLVAIDPKDLPYSGMRRNAKLIKMHGNLIFPWTERIIWQDAKFRRPEIIHTRPSDYLQWFHHNVKDVCASFYGLPIHKDSVGYHAIQPNYILNEYRHHCETIAAAMRKRPDVTDSMSTLLYQCREYLYQHHTTLYKEPDLLSLSLIDSAFIGWDLRTPVCRDFIAELTCTWADEVQCYSDRDQVSFPHVMRQLQLKVAPSVDPVHHNIVLIHQQQQHEESHPMVRITQSQCHWYYHELDMCKSDEVGIRNATANKVSSIATNPVVVSTESN